MTRDEITSVEIDDEGRLRVRPSKVDMPLVWRAAMEVYWDASTRTLYSPKPREWTYPMWFQQLLAAAHEYGVHLTLSPGTHWSNVPGDVRVEIEALPEWKPRDWTREEREQRSKEYALEVLAAQIRPEAHAAFRGKRFVEAVHLFTRIKGALSDAERMKLAYAIKRAGAKSGSSA